MEKKPTIKSVMEQYKVSRIFAKNMIFLYFGSNEYPGRHYDGVGFRGTFDDFVKWEIGRN